MQNLKTLLAEVDQIDVQSEPMWVFGADTFYCQISTSEPDDVFEVSVLIEGSFDTLHWTRMGDTLDVSETTNPEGRFKNYDVQGCMYVRATVKTLTVRAGHDPYSITLSASTG